MKNSRNLIITSLFASFICVLTVFPKFPLAYGYIHLGDSLIIASAFFIGIYSVPAAAIGSALADIISGYAVYAPATAIIKGLMALAAFALISKKGNIFSFIIASVVSELIMLVGYFLFELALYGLTVATVDVSFSLLQAAGGITIGTILCVLIKKLKLKEKYFIR